MKQSTLVDLKRERDEARVKLQRDEISRLKAARMEGHAEGRTEGEKVGIIQVCQRSLQRPVTPKEELLALPAEELKRLAEQWEKELLTEPSKNS
jgi:hypothetical protein